MDIYVVIGGILIGLLIGLLIGVTAYKKYKSWRHGKKIKNGIKDANLRREMERQDPELYEKLFGEGGKFYEEDQAKLRENRIKRITNRAEEDLKYGRITKSEFDAIVKDAEDNDGYSEESTKGGESKPKSTGMKVRF